MDHQLIYDTECVICLKEIDIEKSNNYGDSDNDNNKGSILYLKKSVLKLLKVDNASLSISNSMNSEKQRNQEAQELFCRHCFDRNVEIHNLFDQIEALGRSLKGLKNCIDDQIRESEEILAERKQCRIDEQLNQNCVEPSKLKRCLRYEISKQIFTPHTNYDGVTNNNTTEIEDNNAANCWDTSENENSIDSTPKEMVPSGGKVNVQSVSTLKTFHKIKGLSVAVQRLPRFIIPKAKFNIQSLLTRNKLRPILCPIPGCKAINKEFQTEMARDKHMMAAHDALPLTTKTSTKNQYPKRTVKFNCIYKDCESSFNSKLARYQHLRKCHGDSDFRQRLQEENALLLSLSKQNTNNPKCSGTSDEQTKFACPLPDCESFDNEEARNEHMKMSHPDFRMKRKYVKRKLKVNKSRTYVQKKPFSCNVPDCKRQQGFYTQADLDLHKLVVHEGQRQSYPCKDCGKYFAKENLRGHQQAVHLKIRKFICQYCGYAASTGSNLKDHLVTHTNERNYKCEICPKDFKTRDGQVIHMRYVHTGERPYRCDRCGKGFVTASTLSKHMKSVHNPHIRPHICHICGKGFPIRSYLLSHLNNSHKGGGTSLKPKKN